MRGASTQRGAIAEIVLHDAPTPSTGYLHDWEHDKASALHLSEIELPALHLVNLTATGLRAAGLQVADLFGTEQPDYRRTRQWALWIWQQMPEAQGLHWMSVRDNTSAIVMLFGDRVTARCPAPGVGPHADRSIRKHRFLPARPARGRTAVGLSARLLHSQTAVCGLRSALQRIPHRRRGSGRRSSRNSVLTDL